MAQADAVRLREIRAIAQLAATLIITGRAARCATSPRLRPRPAQLDRLAVCSPGDGSPFIATGSAKRFDPDNPVSGALGLAGHRFAPPSSMSAALSSRAGRRADGARRERDDGGPYGIQWDKDDLDAMGLLKVDCLALGIVGIRRALRWCQTARHDAANADIWAEDPAAPRDPARRHNRRVPDRIACAAVDAAAPPTADVLRSVIEVISRPDPSRAAWCIRT
jgi:hypothetical protein